MGVDRDGGSRSRRGHWVVKKKTLATRLNRALKAVGDWCRQNRHVAVRDQHHSLSLKRRGHCEHYGIAGNSAALWPFRTAMALLRRKWLMRRSGGAGRKSWTWWQSFERRYRLPPARAVHSILRRT